MASDSSNHRCYGDVTKQTTGVFFIILFVIVYTYNVF